MVGAVVIRPAAMADAAAISRLLPELGYAANPQDIERRLGRLGGIADHAVMVAQLGGHVAGLCHVQGVPLLASDGYAEVQALAVAVSSRRMGIGASLLSAAVAWAGARGHARVRLRSGVHRQEAHVFYEAQGFARSKASYAFELLTIPSTSTSDPHHG